jgi:hypothetical protein
VQSHLRANHALVWSRVLFLERQLGSHIQGVAYGGIVALVLRIQCVLELYALRVLVLLWCSPVQCLGSSAREGVNAAGAVETRSFDVSYVKSCVESNHTTSASFNSVFFLALAGFSL